MAGFRLAKTYDDVDEIESTISNQTVVIGYCFMKNEGQADYSPATAATEHWERKVIATSAAAAGTDVVFTGIVVDDQQLWEVDSTNNSDIADNGDRMLFSNKSTINNTGTDNTSEEACVIQVGVVGAASDKRILVRFLDASGVDPSAT